MESKDEEDVFEVRPEDDMMRRRFSNLPNPLQKKKLETYKKFITPTSYDPISYVQHHRKMSKSTSNLAEELKVQQDQQERNVRYEELQKVKQQLKAEEETWTSNLADWKNRRRSVTSGLRERKSMREEVEKKTSNSKLRRMKTYNEMLEEKRHREFTFDENISSFDSTKSKKDETFSTLSSTSDKIRNLSDNVPEAPPRTSSKSKVISPSNPGEISQKKKYAGAVSQPLFLYTESKIKQKIAHDEHKLSPSNANFDDDHKNKTSKKHPLLKQRNIDDYKNKMKVQHIDDEKSKSEDRIKARILQHNFNNNRSQTLPRQTDDVFKERKAEMVVSTNEKNKSGVQQEIKHESTNVEMTNRNVHSVGPAQRKVVMRKKNNQSYNYKTRPVSDYSGLNKTMLPGNISTDSVKKNNRLPSNYHEYNSSKLNKFVANRKSMFANKLNLWQQKSLDNTSNRSAGSDPPKLSTLIQRDSQSTNAKRHDKSNTLNKRDWRKSTPDLGLNVKDPELLDNQSPKETHQKSYTPIVSINNKTLSYSNPMKMKVASKNAKDNKLNKINRSEFNDGCDHEDMRICINQRPKSGKGFGFTVRGGEEGRPVVVDTVQSGGAADVCNLCIGDTITHINKVELVSLSCQDDIVQLIVESIITGKLGLNIRRKILDKNVLDSVHKTIDEKVSATPQSHITKRNELPKIEKDMYDHFSSNYTKPPTPPPLPPLSDASSAEFPLPPVDLMAPDGEECSDGSFKHDSRWRDNDYEDSIVSNTSSCEELQNEILDINHELQTEHQLLKTSDFHEHNNFRQKLLNDQRKLEEEEAIRDEMRRMRKLQEDEENKQVQLQLIKIENEKKEHLKKQEAERKLLIENSFNFVAQPRHWMVEEAERRRKAENEGKYRNIFNEQNTFDHLTNEIKDIPDDQPSSRARATLL